MPEITAAVAVEAYEVAVDEATISHALSMLAYDYTQQRKDIDQAAESYWKNRPVLSLEAEHSLGNHRGQDIQACQSCAGDRLIQGISRFSKRFDHLWK